MALVLSRSMVMLKDVEYAGVFVEGNSLRIFDGTKLSVNRTPFLGTLNNEMIRLNPNSSYSVEKDTVVGIFNDIDKSLEYVEEGINNNNITLVKGVESSDIISIINTIDIPIAKGYFIASSYIVNPSINDIKVTLILKIDDIKIKDKVFTILKNTSRVIALSDTATKEVVVSDKISFTLKADIDGATVKGDTYPSIIREEVQI